MSKPLSERLEVAMHWYENYGELPDEDGSGFQLLREAYEIARRVEGSAPGRVSGYLPGQMAAEVLMSQDASDLRGKFVRLVPEVG